MKENSTPLRLCVASIRVSDMKAAEEFYCNTLGFRIEKVYCPEIIQLVHQGTTLLLEQSARPNREKFYPETSQSVLVFETKDVERSAKEFRSRGVEVLYDHAQSCPVGKYNALRDPFGNVHEILEFAK